MWQHYQVAMLQLHVDAHMIYMISLFLLTSNKVNNMSCKNLLSMQKLQSMYNCTNDIGKTKILMLKGNIKRNCSTFFNRKHF